jgi:class 3 adenylate cyclase/tetratricopeptide (TPR) repeat protein
MSRAPDEPYAPGPGDLPPQFGPYRILKKLGKGGMGTVYLARDTRLDRRIALKVPSSADPQLLDRFRQEARAAARVYHRHLCHVYDVGETDGTPYLTMHFIEGRSLADARADFAAQPRRAVALVATLARAMAAAHAAGVLHRDLKPSNVLLDAQGEPVIVDFGLAVLLDDFETRLTFAGDVMGTLAYMPPEQHRGDLDAVGPASDVYALGVTLYELLTGRRPFRGSLVELERLKRAEDFVPPTGVRSGLDPRLDAVCRRALAADPGRRSGMEELAGELSGLLAAATPVAPPPPAGSPTPAAVTMHPTEPRVADEVLALLRGWGWEDGLRRLDERILLTEDERERGLLRLTAGLLRGQLGRYDEAAAHYREAARRPELEAWAAAGEAFVAYRRKDLPRAAALLDRAEAGDPRDQALTATVAHLRGTILYQQARDAEALPLLFRAAELYGPDHPAYGRVLDTLGMACATRGDFALAHAFFTRSVEAKVHHDDRPGLALTYGQLGRLALDWGDLDGAQTYFNSDLGVCWSIGDLFGEAKMYNHLGQVALARIDAVRALGYLDESVGRAEKHGWADVEAYARKDRALAYLARDRLDDAEADARRAEELFRGRGFPEGTYHARRALARVAAARGRHAEAEEGLRAAAAFFAGQQEHAEAARTWLELAALQRKGGRPAPLVAQALRQALDHAERSRREAVVEAVERELAEVSPAELAQWRYERVRGRGIPAGVTSLTAGSQETASMLFLDLRNSTEFTRREDVLIVRCTLSQVWADLDPVLERHDIIVNQYLGDGFMAFARGGDHDRRAVAAGVDLLAAVEEFNRPRRLLGIKPIEVRVGVSRGSVVFANVGTYRKIDFTAVGSATNEAARLQAVAEPGAVCVSGATWEHVRDAFAARDEAGRAVPLKGFGLTTVWDVVGRR